MRGIDGKNGIEKGGWGWALRTGHMCQEGLTKNFFLKIKCRNTNCYAKNF